VCCAAAPLLWVYQRDNDVSLFIAAMDALLDMVVFGL